MSPHNLRIVLSATLVLAGAASFFAPADLQSQSPEPPPVVFVSRQIPPVGSVFWDVPNDMPGVGSYSRFRVAAPGRLLVRESNGSIRVLVDGANPTPASLNLIDVNAPDVSWDGTKIVFSGFPADEHDPSRDNIPLADPDSWRIYVINSDGSGLRQLTTSDQDHLDYSQFGITASGALQGYDDADPVWLPDGRIVFSSTRWPAFGQYSAARATNLYVMNGDGSNLHRITAERSGADRPVIDPLTGKIVFSRWWRNHRFATNLMDTVPNNEYDWCCEGYYRKDGLTMNRGNEVGGPLLLFRNLWHLASINPDGTELQQFAGAHHSSDAAHAYGGSFEADGDIVANYFPMTNMSEAAGFGGLRRYKRGEPEYESIIGITARYAEGATRVSENPPSFGILVGNYAGEPAVLPDGRIVISWARDVYQDYGLYVIDPDGSNRTLLYDLPGATELRAKLLIPRQLPPIIPDTVNTYASLLPPTEQGPYDMDGTFIFDALNVYGNGPVDTIEASAPAVGSAAKIRFFADFQRVNWGSLEMLDWPILLAERDVNPDGSVRESAPANIQLFEQIRSADGTVPFTMGTPLGATHVAGMNYGKPGQVARCVGCHAGHTMIPVPDDDEEAKWSNLAPGASIVASSSRHEPWNSGLVDRRVRKGSDLITWSSAYGAVDDQWVELVFPEPVTVRTVRLYNVRPDNGSTLQVHGATVRLGMPGAADWVASGSAQEVSVDGTEVTFPHLRAQRVRIEIDSTSGRTRDGYPVASLAEVEVIARAGGDAPPPPSNTAPTLSIASPADGTTVSEGTPVSLQASATDTQDGDLAGLISWASSLDGPLGAGPNLSKTLSVGVHQITASVTDSGSLSASKSVGVTVTASGPGNTAPTLTITSPAPGTSVQEGTPVLLQASAADEQDGDLSSSIAWSSSLDGPLGSGASLSKTLSVGVHQISAEATDSGGLVAKQSLGVTVTAEPPPPPSGELTVTAVTPSRIDPDRAVEIRVTGTGFESGATASLVNGKGRAPRILRTRFVNDTTLTVTVRAFGNGPKGDRVWDVVVVNKDGASAVLPGGLTVSPR